MTSEHVLICVAWPYANGPLHLGHVAGCYLPPDIHYRFERAMGHRVLMVSGSDEHGTPITVTAEQNGVTPQDVVDKYHAINQQALADLGCAWATTIDHRGSDHGGALFNRTSDPRHKELVREHFSALHKGGFFEQREMEQYYEHHPGGGGRFLPDRYVEGTCPACGTDGARGDQCDACGATYEAVELQDPVSKMNPTYKVSIKPTEHLFYRLDAFQQPLELHAQQQHNQWKSNVRAMTKQWLDMGLRPRAVTRDLRWGIDVPMSGAEWDGKCIYVWFEAVQGYLTCAKIWAERYGHDHPDGHEAWKRWWCVGDDGTVPRHLYFLGKDNIPFHTVIWPALILGLNAVNKGEDVNKAIQLPGPGELALETNVPAMEYLMLAGGQFSKSRKHAVWLPSFLERYDPDTLRYYLSINMPENHDTDFNWPDFVERVNAELIAAYGNFVHRVLTLGARLPAENGQSPFEAFDGHPDMAVHQQHVASLLDSATQSLSSHRYKESLRHLMSIAQYGNQILQAAAPWKHLKERGDGHEQSLATLAFCWRISRSLAVAFQPFLPTSSQRLWSMLGHTDEVQHQPWASARDWTAPLAWSTTPPQPLFQRLDLEEILKIETSLVEEPSTQKSTVLGVKGGKKSGGKHMKEVEEGVAFLKFEDFLKVELKIGRITTVQDHPNADKLFVVTLDDGSTQGRTICAGLKDHYTSEELQGKTVVFVANLAPRKLRGIMSEGMMLAADDGSGNVCLLTIDGSIASGSEVR